MTAAEGRSGGGKQTDLFAPTALTGGKGWGKGRHEPGGGGMDGMGGMIGMGGAARGKGRGSTRGGIGD